MSAGPGLWAVVGATGTGKSEFALDLAERLACAQGAGSEIVGADAMQLYRGMDIGTAKVAPDERRGIPHHMIDVLDVTEEATVAGYQPRARRVIEQILHRGRHAILVGGSGLYVSSVLYEFHFPPRDPERRAALEREADERGLAPLMARLEILDPATAARVDRRNARRVIRALEIAESGAAQHGAVLPSEPVPWRAATVVMMQRDRAELVDALDRRVERMWEAGLVTETERLREAGLERGVTARRAIGYAQALAQLRGERTAAEAIAETQALTRRYARRQVSWFRRLPGAIPLDPSGAAAFLGGIR